MSFRFLDSGSQVMSSAAESSAESPGLIFPATAAPLPHGQTVARVHLANETGMFRVTQQIDFCYGHRLLNYDGKCKNLHGHNGRVEILLEAAKLDSRGMLVDFGDIKRHLRTWIDNELDHKLILHRHDPLLPAMLQFEQPVFIIDDNPTAENIAKVIYNQARTTGLPVAQVSLWETPNSCAIYCPGVQPHPER